MQKRIADYGVQVGELPAGARNKISDVPGVTVGHCTLHTARHHTGVTVVVPAEENVFLHKLPAAAFVWNGFGKTAGLVQVQELGSLETPIVLTNTLNVGLVQDALVGYTLERCRAEGAAVRSVNPVVCECNDGTLNDIAERAVGAAEVAQAFADARADFAEGAVGAGAGMVCHDLKGGVGSASRVIELNGRRYTVGVLVLANHGNLADLTIGGERVGPAILKKLDTGTCPVDQGSCIVVLGTDLPASERQLGRILRRCSVGLARLGSYVGHGSGEIMVGFSTAWRIEHGGSADVFEHPQLNEERMDLPFRAAAEATEEAVLNAMICADTVTGYDGTVRRSLRELWPL